MALRTPNPEHRGDEPRWQLQEAKQRFSEIVRLAEVDGPQIVTRHGEDVVAVISTEEYREYLSLRESEPTLKEYLLAGPFFEDFEIPRSKEPIRPFDFDLED